MTKDEGAPRTRAAAVVILSVAIVWLALQWVGRWMGWTPRTMALFDLFALAGFSWALVNVYRVWRARGKSED